ncbi:helix-turn-helix transcriptional regulator [Pseudomaricurvus alkylphenolicus]|uniref:helix-turn-helix transcriptional regulator n=1 Tax=Pseudomaricurvus alkylphenolicus TaxID=1306991 RepID=UPI001423B278|nr:helix-turn-helix transcriptional regulator [Pseudomaricurvus alkylphenolicus]NIB40789.1 helix-turn-helix transcriptional regulator [Pseudomaricurvus alkylphenolicus]
MNPDVITGLVANLGSESFTECFFDFWDELVGVDQCTAWRLHPDTPPVTLVSERPGEDQKIRTLCQIYSEGLFHQDPQIEQDEGDAGYQQGVMKVSAQNMAADDYRRVFFEEADLQEKLLVFCPVGESVYYLNLYRRNGRAAFSDQEQVVTERYSQLAATLLDKQFQWLPPQLASASQAGRLSQQLEPFFATHPAGLSAREASTCAHIVAGHSNESIALNLDVSVNTVRTFRRRAYAKLNIATQNELFALCLEGVER